MSKQADLVFVIGGNPPSNHPRLMTTLMQVKQEGKVIVVNPAVEVGLVNFKVPSNPFSLLFGTPIADLYIQPHIGGRSGNVDRHCQGNSLKWGRKMEIFSISIVTGATEWLSSKVNLMAGNHDEVRASVKWKFVTWRLSILLQTMLFCWTMGITHHEHGVQNVQAIANLAMMRGMLGRPHAGLLPVRGHSNVQGIGSVGVTPKLKDAIFDALESELNVSLPTTKGLDTLGCMEAADREELSGVLFGRKPLWIES